MTLRLLADENIPASLIRALRSLEGVEVLSIIEDHRGVSDEEVLDIARHEGALIVTADTDFGTLAVAGGHEAPGVLLLRTHPLRAHQELVLSVVRERGETLLGHFAVLTKSRLRLRRLGPADST